MLIIHICKYFDQLPNMWQFEKSDLSSFEFVHHAHIREFYLIIATVTDQRHQRVSARARSLAQYTYMNKHRRNEEWTTHFSQAIFVVFFTIIGVVVQSASQLMVCGLMCCDLAIQFPLKMWTICISMWRNFWNGIHHSFIDFLELVNSN